MKSRIKEFYSRYQIFVYPTVIGLASLMVIVLVVIPQIQGFIEGQSTLSNTTQKAKFLEVKAAELSRIDPEDLSKKVNLAVSALPTDKDYGSIIGLIQRIGADAGANIVSLTISPAAGEKNLSFAVQLTVVGLKQSVNSMIEDIEKSPRVMKVSNINITSSNIDGSVGADFVVNVFYAPAPKSLGAVETELPKLTTKDEEILATLASSSVSEPALTAPSSAAQLLPRGKANPFQ